MATLNELMKEYGGAAFVYADAGNGCGFGEDGQALPYTMDMERMYGAIQLAELSEPHISDDGIECKFASDWITVREGDNPYRVRLFF